jgi:hypothetical protein
VKYGFLGGGLQLTVHTRNDFWFATLGAEARLERVTGDAYYFPGQTPSTTLVRPWVAASFGFKGLFLPLPGMDIVNYYATRSRRIAPITRFEIAVPVWARGGAGPSGVLARAASAPQVSVMMGIRFSTGSGR